MKVRVAFNPAGNTRTLWTEVIEVKRAWFDIECSWVKLLNNDIKRVYFVMMENNDERQR